jgi:hypothetical protein
MQSRTQTHLTLSAIALTVILASTILVTIPSSGYGGGPVADLFAQLDNQTSQAEEDTRPVVIGNTIRGCPACVTYKGQGDRGLPFRIVWRENYEFSETYPVFQYPHKDGRIYRHWNHTLETLLESWGLDAINTAEYKTLIEAELEDDIITYEEFQESQEQDQRRGTNPQPSSDPSLEDSTVGICCCQGKFADRCMCISEMRSGIRRGPCGCSSTQGTRHYLDNNQRATVGPVPDNGRPHLVPLLPTTLQAGGTTQAIPYCPNCQRSHQ